MQWRTLTSPATYSQMLVMSDSGIDDFVLELLESKYEKEAAVTSFKYDDEDQDDEVDGGLDTILASTEKILAVNRGLVPPDERDSLRFRKIYTMDKLLKERITMDAENYYILSYDFLELENIVQALTNLQ